MKSTYLNRTGLGLILAGMVGVVMTAAGMIGTFEAQTYVSAAALAEGISNSMLSSGVGAVLILAGFILVLIGWKRSRLEKLSVAPRA